MTSLTRTDYEGLLYSLTERHSAIATSTLRLYTISAQTAIVRGSVTFRNSFIILNCCAINPRLARGL